jgi:hypothetical protein
MSTPWSAKFTMSINSIGNPVDFTTYIVGDSQPEILDSIVKEVNKLYKRIEEQDSSLLGERGIYGLEVSHPDGSTSYSRGPMNVSEIVHYAAMHRITLVYTYQHSQLRMVPAIADLIRGQNYRPFLLPDVRLLDGLSNDDLVHDDFSAVRAMKAIDEAVARLRSA